MATLLPYIIISFYNKLEVYYWLWGVEVKFAIQNTHFSGQVWLCCSILLTFRHVKFWHIKLRLFIFPLKKLYLFCLVKFKPLFYHGCMQKFLFLLWRMCYVWVNVDIHIQTRIFLMSWYFQLFMQTCKYLRSVQGLHNKSVL